MMMLRYLTKAERQEVAAELKKIGWPQKRIAAWLKREPRSVYEELMRKPWVEKLWSNFTEQKK
jgi:IS30 family transposase